MSDEKHTDLDTYRNETGVCSQNQKYHKKYVVNK